MCAAQTLYVFGRFSFDPVKPALFEDGELVRLGLIELKILKSLIELQGKAVSKEDLMSQVWGTSSVGDNALHVHMSGLRKAIGDDLISTKRGFGYRFTAPTSRSRANQPWIGNLPQFENSSSSFSQLIGRDNEIPQISHLLSTARLITLTGPGGVGKTSLGIQVARECAQSFPDGIWFVELSTLHEPKIAASQIAATLGLGLGKTPNPVQTLGRLLREKNMLLVLDNCEHLAEACGEICEIILSGAPKVRILATSRHALSCAGEIIFAVLPLGLPSVNSETPSNIRKSAAFELFLERSRGAATGFQIDESELKIATRICRRVDGLPLAIEMVASWAAIFGLDALDEKLSGSISSWPRARNTAPSRHSTLTATLEWSHGLLSAHEQVVLRRLSVFTGPFAMRAAEEVVSDAQLIPASISEIVATLMRKSMVQVVPGTRPPTFRLMETTRVLMMEKLAAAPEASTTRRCHARYVLSELHSAIEELEVSSDAIWLRRYAPLLPDVRVALDWATVEEPELAIALAGVGWPLWREMSAHVEGRQFLTTIISLIGPDTPPALGLRARRGLAELSLNTESVSTAYNSLREIVALYRELEPTYELGSALVELSYSAIVLGHIEDARSYITEAIAILRGTKRPRELGKAYSVLMSVEINSGRYAKAKEAGSTAIRLCEAVGADRTSLVVSANLLEASILAGDCADAVTAGKKLINRVRSTLYTDVLGMGLGMVSCALIVQRKHEEALPISREAMTILREEGMAFWLYHFFALRLALKKRFSDAAVICGYANDILKRCGRSQEPLAVLARGLLQKEFQRALSSDETKQLIEGGKYLTEERAISLALDD